MNLASLPIFKYPRTPHLQGSALQPGDEDLAQVPLSSLEGCYVVIEEKIDGANAAISFGEDGELRLQSRGHYLTGGAGERQFGPLRLWAQAHADALLDLLEDRYILFGEHAYAKHSVWYDRLPHYFHEFDVYDKVEGCFLSTDRRHAFLACSPVLSVPVLYEGLMPMQAKWIHRLLYRSLAKSRNWQSHFEQAVLRDSRDLELNWKQTDRSDMAEGLYFKVEDAHRVLGRYKLVRYDFVQTVTDSGSHHTHRPIMPNQLHADVDLYSPTPTVTWAHLGLRTVRSLDELQQLPPDYLEQGRD